MRANVDLSDLVPPGLTVCEVSGDDESLEMVLRSTLRSCCCPDCGAPSESVRSKYVRKLSDLPASGRHVRLSLEARRFRCRASSYQRQIFTERFDLAEPWSRRTARLNILIHHLALASAAVLRRGSPID